MAPAPPLDSFRCHTAPDGRFDNIASLSIPNRSIEEACAERIQELEDSINKKWDETFDKPVRIKEENKRMKEFIKWVMSNMYSAELEEKLEEHGIDLSDKSDVKVENKKEDNYIKNRLRNIE